MNIVEEVADYLLECYFPVWEHLIKTPSREELVHALTVLEDKLVVIKGREIMGAAVYLTLTDETYANLGNLDITDIGVMSELVKEQGENLHFVMLAATSFKVIREGMRLVTERKYPKTVSWWNPNRTRLHRYNFLN